MNEGNSIEFKDQDKRVDISIFIGNQDINLAKVNAYGVLKLAEEQISMKFMERNMREFKQKQALGIINPNPPQPTPPIPLNVA